MVRSNSDGKRKYDCIGLGVNAVDYLCILNPYPHLDDKVDVTGSSVQGGGPVPTAMVTLAKLGAGRYAILAKWEMIQKESSSNLSWKRREWIPSIF